jgi:hypothetical protein
MFEVQIEVNARHPEFRTIATFDATGRDEGVMLEDAVRLCDRYATQQNISGRVVETPLPDDFRADMIGVLPDGPRPMYVLMSNGDLGVLLHRSTANPPRDLDEDYWFTSRVRDAIDLPWQRYGF